MESNTESVKQSTPQEKLINNLELVVRCTNCNHINKHKDLIKGILCEECREDLSGTLF